MSRTLTLDQLHRSLQQSSPKLDSLYLISGDETLLVIEACDLLRHTAQQSGYTERATLTLEARSDWSALDAALQNTSLFGDQKLVEVHLPSGRPGRVGADKLNQLAEQVKKQQLQNLIVMLTLPRIDATISRSKWLRNLSAQASDVRIPTIRREQLPSWIAGRLKKQQQQVEQASLEWLADKVEGNLLAAHQEIQKLGLLYPTGKISAEHVEQAVLDVARYNVFDLREAMLAADTSKALAILHGLKAEGTALPLVLWAVGEEIRLLARLATLANSGHDISPELRRQRVFGKREQLVRQTVTRASPQRWPAAVQHAHDIDRLIKGLPVEGRLNDPWEELSRLLMRLSHMQTANS